MAVCRCEIQTLTAQGKERSSESLPTSHADGVNGSYAPVAFPSIWGPFALWVPT